MYKNIWQFYGPTFKTLSSLVCASLSNNEFNQSILPCAAAGGAILENRDAATYNRDGGSAAAAGPLSIDIVVDYVTE